MAEKKRILRSGAMVGGSSLLVIFAVLCMTVLALLALNTAKAGGRLADASVEATLGYYRAERQAEEILARLRGGELPDGVTRDGDLYRYTCTISDRQALEVEVLISGEEYRILCRRCVSTVDWSAEDELELWDGEFE